MGRAGLSVEEVKPGKLGRADAADAGPLRAARSAASLEEARHAVREVLGTDLVNDATDITATLSNRNAGKKTSGKVLRKSRSLRDHAMAVANADAPFKRATLQPSHPDVRGEPTIAAIHRFRTSMEGVGGPVSVKLTVKKTAHPNTPNPLYSIEAEPGRNIAPEGKTMAPDMPDSPRTEPRHNVADGRADGNAAPHDGEPDDGALPGGVQSAPARTAAAATYGAPAT